MLFANWLNQPNDLNVSSPILVFLHGFLGNADDFTNIAQRLPFPALGIDLPGHGQSASIACQTMKSACILLNQTLNKKLGTFNNTARALSPVILIGYSLGARLALYWGITHLIRSRHAFNSTYQIERVILENGHTGLSHYSQRKIRYQTDCHWASRLRTESLEHVLKDWYQQSIFANLTPTERAIQLKSKSQQQGASVAQMLCATSLAKQPNLLPLAQRFADKFVYISGEYDAKFQQIAKASRLTNYVIQGAGHNTHSQQPERYIACLEQILSESSTRHRFTQAMNAN